MKLRVLAALALLSCGDKNEATPLPPPPPPPQTVQATECLADTIGKLDPLRRREDCTRENAQCAAACATGDAVACYSRGLAVNDEPEALGLYARACRLGHRSGCTNYAATLWRPDSPAEEVDCAERVFEKTCEANDSFGCGMKARIMVEERGQGAQVRPYLAPRCNELGGFSCSVLALYLEEGRFGAPDPEIVRLLLVRACETDPAACGKTTAAEVFY